MNKDSIKIDIDININDNVKILSHWVGDSISDAIDHLNFITSEVERGEKDDIR